MRVRWRRERTGRVCGAGGVLETSAETTLEELEDAIDEGKIHRGGVIMSDCIKKHRSN